MLAAVLVATVASASPVRVTVEVVEYATQRPILGARVKLVEDPPPATGQPLEVTATTAAKGKARFEIPHLNFRLVEATRTGYLTEEQLQPWRELVAHPHLVKREKHGDDALFFEINLVPSDWVAKNVRVHSREQALAIANDWATDCGPSPAPTSLEVKDRTWVATYSCMVVRIDQKDGRVGVVTPPMVTSSPLYSPAEALKDAVSSPLRHVDTRVWDLDRISSCIYRNASVIVINEYCTTKEIGATGIEIVHPKKGRVHLYAEANGPISTTPREDWDQWKFSTTDPYPGLDVSMTIDQLFRYDTRSEKLAIGGCVAGMRLSGGRNAVCYRKSPEIERWWAEHYKPLLNEPPPEWYVLVKELRHRAAKDGRRDPRPHED